MERCRTIRLDGINVRALFQEGPHGLSVTGLHSLDQCCGGSGGKTHRGCEQD
jgi:hypothetical protein